MASISAVDIQEEGTYAQRYGWMEHGYHKARPIALCHGFGWGRTEALRDWLIGCFLQLCQQNQYYDGPPSSTSSKLTQEQILFVDTSDLWKVQEVEYTADFRSSRWISVRISNPAEDVTVWTNVVREPNAWRPASQTSWNHYTNWHTQWGVRHWHR